MDKILKIVHEIVEPVTLEVWNDFIMDNEEYFAGQFNTFLMNM
jgi:hypothetical protein